MTGEVASELPKPRHVAIVMDGNGRWAQERGLPRSEGHRAGTKAVQRVVEACQEFGIRYLTLYAFSTENWKRPPNEVRALMALLREFLDDRLEDMLKNGIRLNVIGQTDRLPRLVRSRLERVIKRTAHGTEGTLTLALSYGSRTEIVDAARRLAEEAKAGTLDPADITEDVVASRLYTADLPDPDLVIRTAGEKRLSNFLLWQLSYAEFWFTDLCWPDFDREVLLQALSEFGGRKRRFGGLTNA
jgi:undecaprenyl diphosphate synthase